MNETLESFAVFNLSIDKSLFEVNKCEKAKNKILIFPGFGEVKSTFCQIIEVYGLGSVLLLVEARLDW